MSNKATNENFPPNVIKQLAKELKNLDETPPEGSKVAVNDDDFSTIFADVEGPGCIPEYMLIAAGVVPLGEPVVGASATHRKDGLAVKAQVDKKKMDAREKSLKRL
ncbi:hypothetical protein BHE74_00008803 [Ensete ventricosum]|nr:hypothetical protein BHE74_00008803 [Ensete ventricosum]RZR87297.1 hypothetical protein BHM03_00014678 [Ensete ventricosum]